MKTYTLIAVFLTITLFFLFKYSFSETLEEEHYILLDNIEEIEIREYKELIYASFTPPSKDQRNMSFRNIAPYIFGENSKNEKIEMTSPVVIKMHNKNEMAFIMPNRYELKSLPKPNNKYLKLYEEKSNIKAAIRFSGYSNSTKEKKIINRLKSILNKNNISFGNDFELLVYNSPYEFVNRRNEITVSIKYNKKTEMENKIYFGSGCFWCTEAIFEDVIGVTEVVSGYAGGYSKNPTYSQVTSGKTNHAEVCMIKYDENKISLEELLEIFFLTHDPTTINRQGNDIGSHYRSIVLYNSISEKKIIDKYKQKFNNDFYENKIVTEIKKLEKFYGAETYHQNYYKNNLNNPYCSNVITPKVIKARKNLNKYY